MRGWFVVRILSTMALLIGLAACAGQSDRELIELGISVGDSQKIFGGKEVESTDDLLNFVVAIEAQTQSGRMIECTGTLIHPRVVLTAAHCTEDSAEYLSKVTVRFRSTVFRPEVREDGRQDLKIDRNIRQVVRTVRPARWDELLKNDSRNLERTNFDVALLLLAGAAPEQTKPVMLLPFTGRFSVLPSITAVGFGATGGFIDRTTGQKIPMPEGAGPLRTVELYRSPMEESKYRFDSFQFTKGICYGDSGGPALTKMFGRWAQIGVASYVTHDRDSLCKQKGFFLNIGYAPEGEANLLTWIRETVEQLTEDRIAIYGGGPSTR